MSQKASEAGDKVWYKDCPGVIEEVLHDATNTGTDTLYLVNFGEAGNIRLFGSELEPG